MYKCPFCVDNSPTIKFLVAHIKLAHSASLSTFICKQQNCTRSFTNIYSFKRHLIQKHNQNNNFCNKFSASESYLDNDNILCHELVKSNNVKSDEFKTYIDFEEFLTTESCQQLIIDPLITLEKFNDIVTHRTALFVSKLYSDASLSRSFAHQIIQYVDELYKSIIEIIKKKYEYQEKQNVPSNLKDMCIILQNAFAEFKTEYQTLQYFIRNEYLIMPQSINIATIFYPKRIQMHRSIGLVNRVVQIVPIKSLLTKFLQLPNVFQLIMTQMCEIKCSNVLTSIIHGEVWKNIEKQFTGKLVLPLLLYFDDFEINNPLGSHSGVHKLAATYCTIPIIPNEYSSMLENIFLFQLHDTKDHVQYGNKIIFFNLVNQIKDLETNGLIINVNNKQQKVYFALIGILGDNLGLHTIFGFSKSFNSLYSCRACLADKTTLQNQISEESEILRTRLNYATDCVTNTHGIQEECIFNTLSSSHVIENICFDIMHDIYEGICRYEIVKILHNFIYTEKFFSLDILNDRIRFFDYPVSNNENIPPIITKTSLKNEYILISASEMSTLVKFLGLIIGDLIPVKNKFWELYMILREIICIIETSILTRETCELLGTLISEHHKLYLDLFKEKLKPKHHYLIHYPRIIMKMGPLKYLSCIRFEAKHKEIKQNAKVVTSRRNPSYTFTLKHQLKLTYRFIKNKGFENRFSVGVVLKNTLTQLDNYNNFKSALSEDINENYFPVWLNINGIIYKPGMIIEIDTDGIFRFFGHIQYIIINNDQYVHYIYKNVKTIRFSQHIHAFEVARTEVWDCIAHTKLMSVVPNNMHVMADGKYYISCS